MPLVDREARNAYTAAYKRRKRLERGLQKSGRKPYTEEEWLLSKENRKAWEKEWMPEYRKARPAKKLLWAATRRAKERKMECTIVEEDIVIPTHCPYLGIPLLSNVPRGSARTHTMSLDRIDNTKGYVKGNIEVVSHLANTMKSNASPEQLLKFAEEIIRRQKS